MSGLIAPLRLYLRLAFGICWGMGLLMLFLPGELSALKTGLWLLAVGGAPTIAALATSFRLGPDSFSDYLRRIRAVSLAWCVLGPAFLLALHYIAAIGRGSHIHWPGLEALGAGVLATTLADPGPFEEFGWRGFLQPLLQNRLGPLRASLAVGVIWGLWHLPVLIIPSFPQHDATLPLWLVIMRFIAQTTALSVIMGFVLNRAHGAIAPAMLMHWAANQGAAGHLWEFDQTAWTLAAVSGASLIAALHLSRLVTITPIAIQRIAARPS